MPDSATPWTASRQASLPFTISQSLLKLMSVKSVMLSNHLILCHSLLLLPSIFLSIRVFSSGSAFHIRWPKYGSFSISPSSDYSEFISCRIDWFDISAVQGTLKSLLSSTTVWKHQFFSGSTFFMVQLSHLYMTTGKTVALTRQTFVGKVMFVLFNTLSRFVKVFLPRSKCLLISWQQYSVCSDFGVQENKTCHCLHFFPFYLLWSMRPNALILVFRMLSFKHFPLCSHQETL